MKQGQACPECGDPSSFCIVYSRMTRGRRRRRRHCKSCGFLSVDFDGEQVEPPGRPGAPRRFTPEQVAAIIASSESHSALSRIYGCSYELIRQIRAGQIYRDLLPDGYRPPPRRGDPSCERCRYWDGEACRMGFPDPQEEGPGFARDCELFRVT